MSQASARLLGVLIFCALVVLAGCGGAKARFESHLQRGKQYLESGVLDKASVEFRNALQIEPRDSRARYWNGVTAERRGNVREAVGSYQGAIEMNPDYTTARAALARLYVYVGAASRALPVVEAGLAKHPGDPELLTARSAARLQLKDMEGALADAEQAVKAAPDDANTVALLAAIYQRQGDVNRAVELVSAAVQRQPGAIDLRQVLARLYLATKQDARSEEQLKEIIVLAPKSLAHRYQLAAFYQQTGNLDAAQQVLEEAVKTLPDSNEAKLALVDFIANQRSREQGEKVLRSYVAQEPDNNELRLGLGTLLQRAGAKQEAVTAYNEIIKRDPKSAASLIARDRIAAIEIADGHPEAAQPLIAAVLEQSPRDVDALLMRGNLALEADNPAAAIADLRAVLREQPNLLEVQRTLARAYIANGERPLAEETLRAAMQSAPANLPVRLDLAQLLQQTGRADAAVTLLEETVRQAPRAVGAREALTRAYLAKGDLAAARAAAEDLKTLAPDSASGPFYAGLVAQRQNRIEDARREFERALALKPEAMDVMAEITKLDLTHGQGASAVARLDALVQSNPKNVLAQNLLGETLTATRAYPQAILQFNRTIELSPKWPLPYRNLAVVHLDMRDNAGAEAAYQQGLKANPYDPALTAGLAELYEQQGRIDQAIALYEALHSHDARLDIASNNLAMLLITYRTDRQSLDRARELTAPFATSDSGALLDTHGWVRLKLGDVSDALTALERAAERAPHSPLIHYHLAIAELKAGERDKARSNLETALAGSAHFAGSEDARATLASLTTGSRS
jgi:tetratricopeptide (TPR) repeat protein